MLGKAISHYRILEKNVAQLGRIAPPLAALLVLMCAGCDSGPAPLHLEEHLDAATIEGSEVPEDIPQAVEWRFDEAQPDWKPWVPPIPPRQPAKMTRTDDALRLTLTEGTRWPDGRLRGGLYIDLPDWRREDWAYVLVRARTSEGIRTFGI